MTKAGGRESKRLEKESTHALRRDAYGTTAKEQPKSLLDEEGMKMRRWRYREREDVCESGGEEKLGLPDGVPGTDVIAPKLAKMTIECMSISNFDCAELLLDL
ncbi:hypothetical protein PV326_013314 [Microctonus aethiopoides]|nr:hypothetical protein PV326_013314 [Microctonus aethiopoides]